MSSHNRDIKHSLMGIYEKLSKPNTKDVAYEQYKQLFQTHINSEKQTNYILAQVSDYISALPPKEKEIGLKLLPLIFSTFSSSSKSYQIVPSILSIFQSNITDTNIPILPAISNCFGDVVQYSMKNEIDLKEIDKYEQKIYELFQNFCIYNMKLNDKSNKICGSLCLTKLVENCPLVLQPNYLEVIWENIISIIDKKSFNAKYEVLNCLISMILGAEGLFRPYANVTLYKVLDFLTDGDWLKRKLALNVIYTLILYCKEEILPLKEHIVEFLKGLKSDKVKEVRDVCLLILQIFSENADREGNNTNTSSAGKQNKKPKEKEKEKENIRERLQERERNKKKEEEQQQGSNYISVNTSLSGVTNIHKRKATEDKFSKVIMKSNSNQLDSDNSNDNCSRNDNNKRSLTPAKLVKSKSNKNQLINKSIIDNVNNTRLNDEEIRGERKNRLGLNRKEKSFINEKMVIKRNPNYSIFKKGPNQDFFNQANNQPDIVILDNKKQKNAYQKQEEDNNQELNKGEDMANQVYDEKISDSRKNNNLNGDNDNIFTVIKNKDNQYMDSNSILKNKVYKTEKETDDFNENDDNDEMSIRNKMFNSKNNQQKNTKNNKKADNEDNDYKYNTNDFNYNNNNYNNRNDDENGNLNTAPNNKLKRDNINNDYVISEYNIKNKINLNLNPNQQVNNLSSPREGKNDNNINIQHQNDPISHPSNNSNNNNSKLMTDLVHQMKNLSEKQIFLIDTLAEMQESTATQINSMTSKIYQLESSLSTLTAHLTSLKSNNYQPRYTNDNNQYSSNDYNSFNIKADNWKEIQMNLNQNNYSQALHIALENDSNLIKLINQITLSQLREILPSQIEDSINCLIAILFKGLNISLIISYIKNVLMGIKCEMKKSTKSKIKDALTHTLDNADNINSLTDNDIVDINLILTYFASLT